MLDPFGSRRRVMHSALSEHHDLSPDIYDRLFDRFFESHRFIHWSKGDKAWQLHCCGGPGCGKTTLAALAVRRLRNAFRGTAVPVASIFIQEDVSTNRGAFIEDLLWSIHHQLAIYAVGIDHESVKCYSKYEEACYNGERSATRINLLRRALCLRLAASDFSFFVLDGYDRLDEGLQWLVDRELADLQSQGLRVMTTRRVPVFEDPVDVTCDHCLKPYLELYSLYWECQNCKAEDYSYILCYDCRNNGVSCENDEDTISFKEPYGHVSFHVGQIPKKDMEEFILWDMRREHEDIGFAIQETGVPPLSPTEEDPPRTPSTDATLRKIISFVSEFADGNITIAKIRLEEIHNGRSSEDLDNVRDRLPQSLVALFDAGIQHIERQPKAQRDLALLAIAAAAERDIGVSLTSLEKSIRDAMSRSPHVVNAPPRSLEDILRAANGFLAMQRCNSKDVAIFNPKFLRYVEEKYNDSLYWARGQLGLNDMLGLPSRDGSGLTSSLPIMASPSSVGTSFDMLSDGTIDKTREFSDSSSSHWRGSGGKWTDSGGMATAPAQLSVSDMSITDSPARMDSSDYVSVSLNRSYPGKADLKPRKRDATKDSAAIICSFCKETIFQSRKSSGAHHNSLKALRLSAAEHCVFCTSLNEDICKLSSEHSTVAKWLQYRWALRITGKTRESKGSVVVTFRPQSQDKLPEQHPLGQRKASLGAEKEDNPSHSLSSKPQLASRSFLMFPEQDFVHLPNEEELGWSTDPSITGGDQIRKWIQNCDSNHGGCPKHIDDHFLPTRLIDLDIGRDDMVRIVDTTRQKIKGPYVTLSHSWGKVHFLVLSSGKLDEYMNKGIKLTDLSNNFREAIRVARFIRIRYIWIDSFCIIQGDGGSDFGTEGDLMHKVYRYSYCNIAAADSEDCGGGLFRNRNPGCIVPATFKANDSSSLFGQTTWRILPRDLWNTELLQAKAYTRGWVFQERMLAPRILHFARNQIFWDCGTISACEAIPCGLPQPLDTIAATDRHWRGRLQEITSLGRSPFSGANDDSMEEFWKSSVLKYTSCNLSKQKDKTKAIWSVAKIVRDALPSNEEYGGGMWEHALEEQLAWRVADVKRSERISELQLRNPSWSWASVEGAILAQHRGPFERLYIVKDHNDKPISFDIGARKTRSIQRGRSTSHAEEFKPGLDEWYEWKRKRAQALRQDVNGDRPNTRLVDERDKEPELGSESIAIRGRICEGQLLENAQSGTYSLRIRVANLDRARSTSNAVAKNWEREIILDAFPDELPSIGDLAPSVCKFVILAAGDDMSSKQNFGLGLGLEIDQLSQPDSSEAHLPGVGILLIGRKEYKKKQQSRLEELERKYRPDGKPSEEVAELRKLITKLEEQEQEKLQGGQSHYRRTGAIHFQNFDADAYNFLQSSGAVNFWLD